MNRRSFLSSILVAAVAPAIVRADSLMRILPAETTLYLAERGPLIILPESLFYGSSGGNLAEAAQLARATIRRRLARMDVRNVQFFEDRHYDMRSDSARVNVSARYERLVRAAREDGWSN